MRTKATRQPATPGRNGPATPEGALTPKQEGAALALARGATLEQAAKEAKCGYTTIKAWVAECPAFAARVTEARAELSRRVMARMAGGMITAVDVLERLATASESEGTQLKAAEALLTHGITLTEVNQLKERVAALEGGRA